MRQFVNHYIPCRHVNPTMVHQLNSSLLHNLTTRLFFSLRFSLGLEYRHILYMFPSRRCEAARGYLLLSGSLHVLSGNSQLLSSCL